MSEQFELNAEVRTDLGKGASRRLRHENKIPAVIYGAGKDAISLTIPHDDFWHALENEAFYSHIITLNVGKKKEKAILKDLQRHPFKPALVHADFLRIDAKEKLTTHVPLHFMNENACVGVKDQGGRISHLMNDVEISCLPKDLPEYIEVDITALELAETIHLSDLQLPKGVEINALAHDDDHTHNLAVVTVTKNKAAIEEDDNEATTDAEDSAPEE